MLGAAGGLPCGLDAPPASAATSSAAAATSSACMATGGRCSSSSSASKLQPAGSEPSPRSGGRSPTWLLLIQVLLRILRSWQCGIGACPLAFRRAHAD